MLVKKVFKLNKKEGETPLECMNRFREKNPEYIGISMTYAGRLDPLASGELLVLAGERVHEKEKYCGLDKEYRVEVLLGISTDTYDVLGIPEELHVAHCTLQEVSEVLKSFIGKQNQLYPPYSSRTVEGKPLWQWAREGKLDDIKIPTRAIEIYDISNIEIQSIFWEDVLKRVEILTSLVQGDFRQGEIKEGWHGLASSLQAQESNYLISFTVQCSSGTYIRTLAHELGRKLGIGACVYTLERTKIFLDETKSRSILNI